MSDQLKQLEEDEREMSIGEMSADDIKKKKDKVIFTASFPDLCDLVIDDGKVKFLTFSRNVLDKVEVDGVIYSPPFKSNLPPNLLIASSEKVLEYAQNHDVTDVSDVSDVCKGCTHLYENLLNYHKNISELPDSNLYHLLVAWDFHTYLIEKANFSPIIYFYSIAERGKSRTLKGMTYVAYRGLRKGDIRDAQLLRDCTNIKATLAFDMMDFWDKVKISGSVDVLLNRFERGLTVSRVNRPEKGAFLDTDYYDVFGPTILGTNEIIHDIADTRAIAIIMKKSSKDFENEVLPENSLDLKEQLTAFRLVHFKDNLPKVEKVVKGRLGDITRPLYQIVCKICPENKETFTEMVKKIEKTKLTDKSNSIEAEILLCIDKVSNEIVRGVIACQLITNTFNISKEEKEKLTSRKIGNKIRSLGFSATTTSTGALGFFWDSELFDRLLVEYDVHPLASSVTSVTSVTSGSQAQVSDKDIQMIFETS